MGQRHQVYVKLPNGNTIGIHHQWLFGLRAVTQLKNFLTFASHVDDDYKESCFNCMGLTALESCYSVNINDGYVSSVHKLTSINPMGEDNNNGITVIDLSDIHNPTYCFASIIGLECLDDSIKGSDIKNHVPMGYAQWIQLHYPNHDLTDFSLFFANYRVMDQETYDSIIKHYN